MAVAPVIAPTAIVAAINTPLAAPIAPLPPVVSQPTPAAAVNVPATAVVSTPLAPRIATTNPFESATQLLALTDFGTASPISPQIVASQTPDQIAVGPVLTSSLSARDVANASGMATVSQYLLITPLGTGADGLLNGENSIDAASPSSLQEAADAVFADGDIATGRFDEALLNLLADEACNRN